ncbi:MAG: trigger factor [Candidatus Saccharimonadales bacterium]
MQIKVSYPSKTKAQVTIVADTDALSTIKEQVLNHFAKSAKLAGFREGKAPLALVEKNVDQQALQNHFLEEAIQQLYFQAVTSEKLRVVSSPQIALKKFVPFTVLEFEAEVPVVKEVTLPDYKKIKLAKTAASVKASDITKVLDNLRTRAASRQEVSSAAQNGNEVIIKFKGIDAGTKLAIPGADGTDYPLLLGSNTFIPGFEPNIVGMKAGETKDFTLTFPEDYGVTSLANKEVTFTVTVINVQQLTEPAADDAFAKTVGPFTSIQDLKEDIKKQLLLERQNEADRDYETKLVKKITDMSSVEIPDTLIDDQIDRLEQDERQNLTYRGQTWDEHLLAEGVSAEEHRNQKRPAAAERVKTSLVLAEIADTEQLTVEPEEVEIRIQLLKGQYKDTAMLAELDKPENRRDIEARLLTEKTVDTLVRYAQTK